MQLVVWSDQFSVGVQSLDDQRAILFDTINELHEAIRKGQNRKIVGGLLLTLLKYARAHFATEERMMELTSFPGLEHHKQLHHALLGQFEAHQARYAKGEQSQSNWAVDYFPNWLQTHIQEADQVYGCWVRQQSPQGFCLSTPAVAETPAIQ